MNINTYGDYAVHLIKCSFSGDKPSELPVGVEPEILYTFAAMHKIEAAVYTALAKLDTFPAEVLQRFEQRYFINFNLYCNQQHYLEVLKAEFEKNKVNYIVLKGWAMMDMYSHPEFRQTTDIDIYIGAEQREKSMAIMQSLGFDGEYCTEYGHHDEYSLGNSIHVELHHTMIKNIYPWTEESNKLPGRAITVQGSEYEKAFRDEDYYFFMIAHIAKHLKANGIGIKAIIDVWVYLEKMKDKLNEKRLAAVLKSGSLTDFEKNLRALVNVWFNNAEPTEETKVLETFLYMSGWNGNEEQLNSTFIANKAAESKSNTNAKLRMYMQNVFPQYEYMVKKYPVLSDKKYLLPFYYFKRLISVVFGKRSSLKRFNERVNSGDIETGRKLNDMRTVIGL